MGTKKNAAYGGSCKVCNKDYKSGQEVFMQKDGDKWIICIDEECFKQQGGVIEEKKQGFNKFSSSKFQLSEASQIFNIAMELTTSFKKNHPNLSIEVEAQFLESMFKTLAGSFKN